MIRVAVNEFLFCPEWPLDVYLIVLIKHMSPLFYIDCATEISVVFIEDNRILMVLTLAPIFVCGVVCSIALIVFVAMFGKAFLYFSIIQFVIAV